MITFPNSPSDGDQHTDELGGVWEYSSETWKKIRDQDFNTYYGYTVLDEDDMVSDRADAIATQQSIRAYVNNQIGDIPPQKKVSQSYTLQAQDRRRLTLFSHIDPTVVTVPPGVFSAGDWFWVQSVGNGGLSLNTTGLTVNGNAPVSVPVGQAMTVIFTDTNTISVFGGSTTDAVPPEFGDILVGAATERVGGETWADATTAFETAIGAPIDIARRFRSYVVSDFTTEAAFSVDIGNRHRFVSMKENTANAGITFNQWRTFLLSIPDDGYITWVTGHHEPENDGGGHTTTWFKNLVLATLHAAWVDIGSPGHIRPSVCVMSWHERDNNSSTSSALWFPDESIIDDFTLWIDPYDTNSTKQLQELSELTISLWKSQSSGPWGIAETGTKRTGNNGVTWINNGFDWARAEGGCAAIMWFHSSVGAEGPWWLSDPLMQAAWGAQVAV